MRRVLLAMSVLLVLSLPILLASCGPQQPIKIGLQCPLTGDYAYEGQGFEKAVRLLVDKTNAEGGLLGRQIELIVEDDKGDPEEAAQVAQRLVDQGVVAVIGGYNSTATEKSSEIYSQHGILNVTPSSTATHLTEKGFQRFFRVCFLDDRQGLFVSKFIAETLGMNDIAILHDDDVYPKGLAEWTKLYAEQEGLNVVFFGAINPQDTDFTSTLTDLQVQNPKAIYFTGYHAQGGLLLQQSSKMGLETQWILGNACNNPELIQIAGTDAAEGVLVSSEPLPHDLPYPETEQYIKDFEAKYGEPPASIWWLMAADAFNVIRYAIEQTNSTDAAILANFLHMDFKDFPGITGLIIGFDDKGDRLGTIHKAYVITPEGTFRPYE